MTNIDVKDAEPLKDDVTGTAGVRLKFTEDGEERFRALTASIAEQGRLDPTGAFPRFAANREPMLRVLRNHRRAAVGDAGGACIVVDHNGIQPVPYGTAGLCRTRDDEDTRHRAE